MRLILQAPNKGRPQTARLAPALIAVVLAMSVPALSALGSQSPPRDTIVTPPVRQTALTTSQSSGGSPSGATVALNNPTVALNNSAWEAIGLGPAAHFAVFRHPVRVAIIDDGFDLDNAAWAGSIAHNAREIPGNGIDDDHNGKIDDYEGWDFGDNDEEVRPARSLLDKESHGTHVLGIFWQVLQLLSAGQPSGITILPIKAVSDLRQNNYVKEGYRGIEYAIEQKADVIICSWSGPLIAPEEKALLSKARAKGILIVAAAGNFYALQPQYPGAFPSVINVAATNRSGKKLSVSNYGSFVDISAPGDSLVTFDPYARTAEAHISATSAATPVIAAVVTALRAAYPSLSPEDIERLLKNTATPLEALNPLYAGNLGAGLVNVAAIRAAVEKGEAPSSYEQVKAYIDLRRLQPQIPIRITPPGHYKSIKFLLQPGESLAGHPSSSASTVAQNLPDVKVTLFRDGKTRDTLIRKERLYVPFLADADSVYLYSQSAKTHSTGSASSAATSIASPHPGSVTRAPAWMYYEVTTIDSSTLYCGGTVMAANGPEGWIEDGSGDDNYTGRNDCKWLITAPEGKKLLVEFEQFDTEPKIDQVYLFNGNSTKDPILAIFSGHKLPPPIRSWGNTILVWFLTSEENNYQGWKLHYRVID